MGKNENSTRQRFALALHECSKKFMLEEGMDRSKLSPKQLQYLIDGSSALTSKLITMMCFEEKDSKEKVTAQFSRILIACLETMEELENGNEA